MVNKEIISGGKKRKIIQLSANNYILEGQADHIKWSTKNQPDFVELESGPLLIVGHDFYGLGTILEIKEFNSDFRDKYHSVLIATCPSSYTI